MQEMFLKSTFDIPMISSIVASHRNIPSPRSNQAWLNEAKHFLGVTDALMTSEMILEGETVAGKCIIWQEEKIGIDHMLTRLISMNEHINLGLQEDRMIV